MAVPTLLGHELCIDMLRTTSVPPYSADQVRRAVPTRLPVRHTSGPRSGERGTSEQGLGLSCGRGKAHAGRALNTKLACCIEQYFHLGTMSSLSTRLR